MDVDTPYGFNELPWEPDGRHTSKNNAKFGSPVHGGTTSLSVPNYFLQLLNSHFLLLQQIRNGGGRPTERKTSKLSENSPLLPGLTKKNKNGTVTVGSRPRHEPKKLRRPDAVVFFSPVLQKNRFTALKTPVLEFVAANHLRRYFACSDEQHHGMSCLTASYSSDKGIRGK